MQSQEKQLKVMISDAQKLHGHLGPFLVIGVRMGAIARRALSVPDDQCAGLKANVKVPLFPPFSCLLDGIQAASNCTVGNQRLYIEDSEDICANFTEPRASKTLRITLNSRIAEELRKKCAEGSLTEKYALELANMSENQLFNVEIE